MIGETVILDTGKVIYSPFSQSKEVFIIHSGYVIAYTYQDDGKRRIHLIYGPGSYFPVITTFKETEQRATYESLTRTVLTKCSRDGFLAEVAKSHEFSNLILNKTVDQLSVFADRVMDLQITRLEDRLLYRLKALARANGVAEEAGIRLPYKLKHHHLSDMLGAERESISRALMVLRKKGLVSKNIHGYITIHTEL